jgi:hypothetical protein
MTETLETIMDSSELESLIALPPDFQNRKVTVTVQVAKDAVVLKDAPLDEVENQSFGMWKDRQDLADVDGYVQNLRKGRIF